MKHGHCRKELSGKRTVRSSATSGYVIDEPGQLCLWMPSPLSVRVPIKPGTPGRCVIWISSITWGGKGRLAVMIIGKLGFSSTILWLPPKVWSDPVCALITPCRPFPVHNSPTGQYLAGLCTTLDALDHVRWRRSSQRDCMRRTGHCTCGYLAASKFHGYAVTSKDGRIINSSFQLIARIQTLHRIYKIRSATCEVCCKVYLLSDRPYRGARRSYVRIRLYTSGDGYTKGGAKCDISVEG